MQETSSSRGKNSLTAAQFENLLHRLDPNREDAGQAYENLRRRLMRFFEWNCDVPSEDLVDETLDRVAQKLDELDIHNVVAFSWGVARNVKHEAEKKAARMVPIPEHSDDRGFPTDDGDTENRIQEKVDREQQLKCLHKCVRRLGVDDQKLFLAYYRPDQDPEARQRLARSSGLTMNALRVRVNRLRDRVEQCTDKCHAFSVRLRSQYPGKVRKLANGADHG